MTDTVHPPDVASADVCTFALLINGQDVGGLFHLLALEVSREFNRIPSARIELRDGDAAQATFPASNTTHFVPGAAIEIRLGYRARNETVFRGVVIQHGIRVRKQTSVLIVECRDTAVRMSIEPCTRHFPGKSDSEVLETLIAAHGLQHDVDVKGSRQDDLVQYHATDWDFMVCRAEANGRVVLADDGTIRILQPDMKAQPMYRARFGGSLIELDAQIDARWQSRSVQASSWNAAEQSMTVASGVEIAEGDSRSGNLSPVDLATVAAGETLSLHHGGSLGQLELQAWADGRLHRERLAKVRARARCQGLAPIAPGDCIMLEGVGDRFAGKHCVSGVRHTLTGGNWETDLQLGLDPRPFPVLHELRPLPAGGLLPGVAGLRTGVVSALEGDPASEGRIAVRLPFADNSGEGVWSRMLCLDAGPSRGTFFRPEIGDEVVIGFLDNDPRHPVVLGMCHSSARPGPEPITDRNDIKGYVSRSGLRCTFDDNTRRIALETPGGNRVTLSDQDASATVEDQHGNRITLDASGIRIESSKDLTLKAAGAVRCQGVDVAIQASARAAMSGGDTSINGNASVQVQGGLVRIN